MYEWKNDVYKNDVFDNFISIASLVLSFLQKNKLFQGYAVVIHIFAEIFQNTYFNENLLMASSEPFVILILFLTFVSFEPCVSFRLYSLKKCVFEKQVTATGLEPTTT